MNRRLELLLGSALAALAMAGSAHAQGQATSPQNEGNDNEQRSNEGANTIQEVVVTAEKREQSLQDVPVAISAFTDETREVVGINSVQDLTNFVPALSYTTNNDRVSLRGIGRFTNNRSSEGGVAIYNDGFYTSSTVTAAGSALFVERTEVLRGPQGTLYGRNSVGGAINVISKRPTDDFYAEIRGSVANFDRTVLEGAVSGPITDNLRYRLVGNIDQQEEGYFTNRSGGPDEGGLGDQWQIQGQLEGNFFDDKLEFWLRMDTSEWHNIGRGPGGRSGSSEQPYQTVDINNGLAFNANFGLTAVQPGIIDDRLFDSNRPNYIDLESDTEVLHVTLHLDNIDVRYVGGHTYYDYRLDTDIDASSRTAPFSISPTTSTAGVLSGQIVNPFVAGNGRFLPVNYFPGGAPLLLYPDYVNDYQEEVWWFSNELNIASTYEGPLQFLVGVYQFREGSNYKATDAQYPDQAQLANPVAAFLGTGPAGTGLFGTGVTTTATPANPTRSYARTFTQNVSESYAAYGQLDYNITETLKTTVGLRYTYDNKRSEEAARIMCFVSASCRGLAGVPGLGGPVAFDFSSQVYNPIVNRLNPIDPSVILRGGRNAATAVQQANADAGGLLPPTAQGATPNANRALFDAGGAQPNGVYIDPGTGEYRRGLENNWSAITGTAGIDWTPDRDTLAYAKYTRGYKAGGFNAGALLANPTTEEEFIDAYEVGVKRTFFGQLQANASAYFYDYKDIQIPISRFDETINANVTEFANLPKARILGFDLETIWSPIENLQFLANYSYLDAEITEACCFLDPDDPQATLPGAQPSGPALRGAPPAGSPIGTLGPVTNQAQDLAGQKLPSSTPHRVTINGNYTWNFTPGDFTVSASYVWRDETYSSIFNRNFNLQPAFDQVDARALFVDSDDRYTVIAYVKNVFDELGYAGVGTARETVPPNRLFRTYSYTIPRTYGLELQYRF